ncbi:PKD domain-containing protein [Methanofollis formosanus]|uniref:PKD domain-containing protein n=1 Tax=Methanofollis formosanus TaxID=299308 RepID=A0A8G1A2Q9_9EURY|nr:PKD domain-containing protein [Methanofollis formosanus]QYZ79628.1 PKD domain-containing protein [Methanofollis formosanus]
MIYLFLIIITHWDPSLFQEVLITIKQFIFKQSTDHRTRRIFLIGIVLLALALASPPAAAAEVTVNPGDSIQTAVKNAAAGDVILIRPGTYVESVTVNKRLTLRGEAGATVNGGITIIADGATIEGLAVNGAAGSRAIDVNWVIDAVVRGCTVSGGKYGIYIESAPNCTVEGCTLDDTITYIGINLFGSGQCRILDNQLSGSGPIGITLGDCPDCIISGNTVQDSDFAGIKLQSGCQGSVIVANTLSNTPSGIEVMDCTGQTTVLRDNTIVGARDEGVFLADTDSLIVENITVRGGGYGVRLSSVDTITLANSTITGVSTGLYVESTTTDSLIANNLFNNTKNIKVEAKITMTGTRWNTTKTAGENIRGGSFIGGNLWLTPAGTGFSQTHADLDLDGICDEGYAIADNDGKLVGTDCLPLQNGGPSAAFTVTSPVFMPGVPVTFNDTSVGAPTSWSWTFGDETLTTRNVTRTYDTAGTYLANLTVANALGTNTTTRTVTIEPFSIQGAVDIASEGDVVLVPAGTYDEIVTVDKRLTLRGSAGATVNGSITVTADGTTVEHLTVNGAGGSTSISVTGAADAVVRGCMVSGGYDGISLKSAGQSRILDNQVTGCGHYGVTLEKCPDCTISGNFVQNCNNNGIRLYDGCHGSVVESNTCSGNRGGFSVSGCEGKTTVLRDNTVLEDGDMAVHLRYVNSVIVENVTARGGQYGVALANVEDLTLTNSTFAGFTSSGLYFYYDYYVKDSLIANNHFNNTMNILIHRTSSLTNVSWNTTKTEGTNIRGGPYLGGNLWLTPKGTGFSQTRADLDLDGICDDACAIKNAVAVIVGTDYLPLQNGGPSANFTITPSSAMTGVPVAFNDTSLSTPTSWLWTFDGKTETTRNVTRTYPAEGTHQVTLTVKNEFGTNTTTRTFDVAPYTIQGAVNAASEGDVVLVPAGTYTETVTVDKNITLRGSENAVLNGRITITTGADGATVENLTVNGVKDLSTIGLSKVSGCTVRYNTVTGGSYGIFLGSQCSDCLVSDNRVEDCSLSEIAFSSCGSGNEIVANTCSGGDYGFSVQFCTGASNALRDNIALDTNGIELYNPGSVIIENLTTDGGSWGVTHYGDGDLTLTNSTIAGARTGLLFWGGSCLDHALIANNRFNVTANVDIKSGAKMANVRWNTTKTFGKNIGGGPYLGGNLWLTPAGVGFSETHFDRNGDGICDEGYDLGAGCIDSLPLHTCLPTANFTFAPAGGSTPLEVQFADTSSGVKPRTYRWDFGDNTPAVDFVHPSHTFTTNGTHQVSLTVTNDFGSDTTTKTVTALDLPVAVVSANLTEGNAPLTVQFTDASTGCVFTRLWDFDDRTNATAAVVSHTFEMAGTYNVILNASNPYASNETAVTVVVHEAPEANFTFTPAAGNTPLTVTFNETSTGDIDTWAWDFGDGTPAGSGRNVTHTFDTKGTFPVILTASNAFGSNATTRTVTVHEAPAAGFDLNISEGNDPLTVLVTNTSTGDFTKCVLDFGDGSGEVEMTGETATHTFAGPDTYTVTLNASNAYGFNITTSTVTVHEAPEANFTQSTGDGNAPLEVAFTDGSTGNVTSWAWDFGDGNVSTVQSPSHEYVTPGTYTVHLNASNAYGFSLSDSTVNVLAPPTANFTQSAEEGNAPLTVVFTDGSTGNVTAWQWDFGDGNVSTEQSPSHKYVTPGTYTVHLNASNAYGFSLSESSVRILPPPKANFTQSVAEGNAPLEVAFTDTSAGNVTSWRWDFGDGNISTEQNPSHEYVTAGTYTVLLNASNAYGFSLSESGVKILSPPKANFTKSAGEGNAPLAVAFTDASMGNVTAWQWDFGDGNVSTEQIPSHEYVTPGTYTVRLNASNAYGFSISESSVKILAPPQANFTQSVAEGNAPLEVTFTDASTGNVTAWKWDFGDGNVSTEQSPSHEYVTPGTYTIHLNASNAYGFSLSDSTVHILPPPKANFTQSADEGNAPLEVTFTDASIGNVTSWEWDFGDGNVSTEQIPSHEYVTPGTYTVQLNASNAYGFSLSDSTVKILPPPQANFTQSVAEGNAPLEVTFTDGSTGNVTAWAWDFGDGNVSTEENPSHEYVTPGTYPVVLNASNVYGFSLSESSVKILPPPKANFTQSADEGNAPLAVAFTDASTGNVTSWKWNFGDGNGSTEENPSHEYVTPGTYTVQLNASNSYGFSLSEFSVKILPPPKANFTQSAGEGNAPLAVTFTDASTGNVTAWKWDFGDGNVSTEENPSHEYVTPGTYPVVLNASNAYGFSLSDSTVRILAPPAANFTQSAEEGNAPLAVTFTDASTGNVTAWKWDFGDGNVSTEENPSHEYVTPSTYTVRLNASNLYGFSLSESSVTILPPPQANFTQSAGEGNAPLGVEFTDGSTGNVTAWQWDFGDGNISTKQNPSHEYVTPGTYPVLLNASNAYGFSLSESGVTILTPPKANFTQSADEGDAPLVVEFTDGSTGNVTAWQWDFGDGNVSTEENPSHEYVTPSTYTVHLNASNAYGFSLTESTVTVLQPPVARFGSRTGFEGHSLQVAFTDRSTGNITAWEWAFGDGTTSTEENPVHTYAEFGTYNVTLSVRNAYDANATTAAVTLTAPSSHGGRSPASAGAASNIPAGGHASFGVRESAIHEVTVTAAEAVSHVLVTVEPTAKPNRVEAPAAAVYEYDQVTLYHTTDEALAGADLDFTVPKTWLDEQGAGPESVVLYRYHDGAWHALPTSIVGEDEHGYSFSAESQGFALFAIGADGTGVHPSAGTNVTRPTPDIAEPVTTAATPATTPQQQSPLPWWLAAVAAGAAVSLRRRR